MADPVLTRQWKQYYEQKGFYVCSLDSRKTGNVKEVKSLIQEACQEKKERVRKRGILNRPIRAMVVGIPNVGKSTFINSFAGKASTRTGNKPGVTKGKQWIKINKDVELLDTPGILWPKFEDQTIGMRLALIGSIRDEILNASEMALTLIEYLRSEYPGVLTDRYGVVEEESSDRILADICDRRGCIMRGGQPDLDKAARLILDDFRALRLARITLEAPQD